MKQALQGLVKIARFDKSFGSHFNLSVSGFWQSAIPSILFLPFHLYLLITVYQQKLESFSAASVPFIVAIETLAYAITWLLFPVILYSALKAQQKTERFFHLIVPYKWLDGLQLVFGLGTLSIAASGLSSMAATQTMAVVLNLLLIAYKYFVIKQTLHTPPPTAIPAIIGVLLMEVIAVIIVRALVSILLGPYLT